ncbi:uncharacterized protein LOC135108320 [Scylla paramamosain]|uniref:uncharacterized protein LOC135108320 n=1 Tax=Scylla paramamosain TaxID=85552 RepID=UPI003083550D
MRQRQRVMPATRSTAQPVLPSCRKIHPHCDLDEIGGFTQVATEGARKDNINTRRQRHGAVCGGEARVCVAAGPCTMRCFVVLAVTAAVAAYGPPRPSTGGGSGCGSGCGSIGGGSQVVTTHVSPCPGGNCGGSSGSGGAAPSGDGDYWWAGKDNPFASPGRPSHVSIGCSGPSCGSGCTGSGCPSQAQPSPAGPAPALTPGPPPGSVQNLLMPPMGICSASYVCVNWQLCREGYVIDDGTGVIDKQQKIIPHRVASAYTSCGGDMICCGVPQHGTGTLIQPATPGTSHSPSRGTPARPHTPSSPSTFSVPGSPSSPHSPSTSSGPGKPASPHTPGSQSTFTLPASPSQPHTPVSPSSGPGKPARPHTPGSQSTFTLPALPSQPHTPVSPSSGPGKPARPHTPGSQSTFTLPASPSQPHKPISQPKPSVPETVVSPPKFSGPGTPVHSGSGLLPRPQTPASSGSVSPLQPSPQPSVPATSYGFPSPGVQQPAGPSPLPSTVNQARPVPPNQPLQPVSSPVGLASPPQGQAGGMGMMGMMGMMPRSGSCSAGTYCVLQEQCNPYTGFIMRGNTAVMAVWPESPTVPFLPCFVPDGSISNGVCCQEAHPNAGGVD